MQSFKPLLSGKSPNSNLLMKCCLHRAKRILSFDSIIYMICIKQNMVPSIETPFFMNAMLTLCFKICHGCGQLGLHNSVTRDFSRDTQYKGSRFYRMYQCYVSIS